MEQSRMEQIMEFMKANQREMMAKMDKVGDSPEELVDSR
jgi:hypothetical protein